MYKDYYEKDIWKIYKFNKTVWHIMLNSVHADTGKQLKVPATSKAAL